MGAGDVNSKAKRVYSGARYQGLLCNQCIYSDAMGLMPILVQPSHKHECIATLPAFELFAGALSLLHHRPIEYAE